MAASRSDFRGTSRFEIRRHLGTGGMGAVYQAYDRDRKEDVALKTVLRADPTTLYLFKREFRNLADVVHPNLVNLYELIFEEGYWFFTMELLDGVDFLAYIREGVTHSGRRRPVDLPAGATTGIDPTGIVNPVPPPGVPALSAAQVERLRFSLRQVAEGLAALHDKGYLHRDLKPPNVLVTLAHRVVILDFGLSREVSQEDEGQFEPFLGTPTYMSPEQLERSRAGPASDWYAVGVMMFEALTGRAPFVGSYTDVLMRKWQSEAPRPGELVDGVPEDLDALCSELLRRDPSARPSAREIIRHLHSERVENPAAARPPEHAAARVPTLVGREAELRQIRHAYNVSRSGRVVRISVHGTSGVGKTALVGAFLHDLQRTTSSALVLSGRCYERESVPYKALDGVMDRLTHYLMSVSDLGADALLPTAVRALAVLFPVLLRVDAVASASDVIVDTIDPLGLRRTAVAALRELLARIGRHRSLVLTIDDFQWTDADSLALLEDLLRTPHAPPLLLILTFRSEEIPVRPFLQLFLEASGDERRTLELRPLTSAEAHEMAVRLLEDQASDVGSAADAIAREAEGNPFLIEQLAACYSFGHQASDTGITVAEMLEIRLTGLPQTARDVLDVLAVAARPTDPDLAASVVHATGQTRSVAAVLRAAQMIRSAGSSDKIEVYHDRIRDALVSRLSDAQTRRIHASLAAAIERSGMDDPEALYEHYLGAAHRSAGTAALAAARRAFATLAFDRAAFFYRRSIELAVLSADDLAECKRQLGHALANAGRTLEAARAFLRAADDFDEARAFEYRRRAAEQLLLGGHVDGGMDVMRTVLDAVDLKMPGGPRRALLALLLRRAQLRVRGLKFTEAAVADIPEDDLRRIDVCWGAGIGLGLVDLVTGAYFQSTQLLLALEAGDPYRIARALAVEAASLSTAGGPARDRAAEILGVAEGLARRVGNPHALGLCSLGAGMTAFLTGQWKKCSRLCDEASTIFRERCTGVTWEQTTALNFALGGLLYAGELAEIERRLAIWLPDARERGNLYAITEAQTRYNICWLAAGDPEAARAEASQATDQWSHRGFHLQHYNALLASAQIDLYLQRAEDALQLIDAHWRELSGSLLMRVQVLRIEAYCLRARARLAVAARSVTNHRLLAMAEADARKIAAERMLWSDPLVALLRGAIARLRGHSDAEVAWLTRAADGFELAGMALHANAASYALGTRIGGDEGHRMVSEAHFWMQTQKIQEPPTMARMIAPGLAIGEAS